MLMLMLGVLRVKSHAHWMVVQVCERVLKAMKASGKTFQTLDSVDIAILSKV